MARKCERCMRGRAQWTIEEKDKPSEYVCGRCFREYVHPEHLEPPTGDDDA